MREGLGCRANGASGYRSWLPGRYTIAYNTQLSNPLPERCSGERVGGREGGRKYVSWQVCLACAALARKGCGFENDVFSRGMMDFCKGDSWG